MDCQAPSTSADAFSGSSTKTPDLPSFCREVLPRPWCSLLPIPRPDPACRIIADHLVLGGILRRSLKPSRNRIRHSCSGADPPKLWVGEDAQAFRVWFSVQACGFRRLFLRRRGRASPFYAYPALIVPSQALLRWFQARLVRDEVPGLSL